MPRIYDLTSGATSNREDPALLKPKPRWSWNPFWYIWTGWEYFAYWFAPADGCQFCWVLRLFLLGFILGWVLPIPHPHWTFYQ